MNVRLEEWTGKMRSSSTLVEDFMAAGDVRDSVQIRRNGGGVEVIG